MAQIYYVDAQLGSDSNNGTNPHEAWQSLENVNTIVFQLGDSILFKTDCEWFGHLHPHGSGTVDKRIKIGSYGTGLRPSNSWYGCHVCNFTRQSRILGNISFRNNK
ncbi:hypothetical protein MGH68_01050 [Erysipelothrix sp. D19-032]